MTLDEQSQPQDESQVTADRRIKLARLRAAGNAYPNRFRRDTLADQLNQRYAGLEAAELETVQERFKLAGRLMAKRVMGKASFGQLQDSSGRIQLFCQLNTLGETRYEVFKTADVGDILGISGRVFRTRTGELSIWVESLELLVKNLRPLPEKWAGLTDTETRYRQRYVDLIVNPEVRRTFQTRAAVLRHLRSALDADGFLEVETPMLQAIPGGATARPFVTHHNALDRELYLRVAQELYIKRLLVGGYDRVYELNRNFRNEGLSTRHNPEFTMLEANQAYGDFHDGMDLTESLVRGAALAACGSTQVTYQGRDYDLQRPFARLSMHEACARANPGIELPVGQALMTLFEATVEPQLFDPTFITEYPIEVSPLARRSESNPEFTDRFELFLGGRELANGFSELNDADDQAQRFREQAKAKEAGDAEAMYYDADYVRALEVGLPPNVGIGIGIDRLVMFLTDSAGIRDVLLFPSMRPES